MGVICEQVEGAVRRIKEDVQNIEDFDAKDVWSCYLDELQASAIKLLTVVAAKRAEQAVIEKEQEQQAYEDSVAYDRRHETE